MRECKLSLASTIALLAILLSGSGCMNGSDSESSRRPRSETTDTVPDANGGGGDATNSGNGSPGEPSENDATGNTGPDDEPENSGPNDDDSEVPDDEAPVVPDLDDDAGDRDDDEGLDDMNRGTRSCQATDGPIDPKTLFHIGHSLTDRMAPLLNAILEADIGEPVDYVYKTSSGTSISSHWTDSPHANGKGNIPGPLSPLEVLQTPGMIDVLSMTEKLPMNWGKGEHADSWAQEFLAHTTNPDPEVFIYSTWYQRKVNAPDDAESIDTWLSAFEEWELYWENLAEIILETNPDARVGIIPAGRVLEELQLRVLEGALILPNGLTFRETFFKRNRPGRYGGCASRDHVHLSRTGIYAAALTHYATVFCASPIGLPSTLPYPDYDDGCIVADEIVVDPDLASEIQEVVWEVVQDYPWTGVE